MSLLYFVTVELVATASLWVVWYIDVDIDAGVGEEIKVTTRYGYRY